MLEDRAHNIIQVLHHRQMRDDLKLDFIGPHSSLFSFPVRITALTQRVWRTVLVLQNIN